MKNAAINPLCVDMESASVDHIHVLYIIFLFQYLIRRKNTVKFNTK